MAMATTPLRAVKNSDGINADGRKTFSGPETLDNGTILDLSEIETINCFTRGTRIATAKGNAAVPVSPTGTGSQGLSCQRWTDLRRYASARACWPLWNAIG